MQNRATAQNWNKSECWDYLKDQAESVEREINEITLQKDDVTGNPGTSRKYQLSESLEFSLDSHGLQQDLMEDEM